MKKEKGFDSECCVLSASIVEPELYKIQSSGRTSQGNADLNRGPARTASVLLPLCTSHVLCVKHLKEVY
jgi:hypothetical protein